MNNYFFTHWFVAVAALFATAIPTLAAGWPDTPLRPVTNVYHGVTVVDNYRWLQTMERRPKRHHPRLSRESPRPLQHR
jgi:hypothetical protein